MYVARAAAGIGTALGLPVLSAAYVATLSTTVMATAVLCLGARRRPGPWVARADRALAVILLVVTTMWIVTTTTASDWSAARSLPLALCDVTTLVAAAALWWRRPILVELTYFWGLAGSLQGILTPDVQVRFPSAEFLEYVVAHAGIVIAALFLVVGQRLVPRPFAVARTLAITALYTLFIGVADAATGGDYMYLRKPPANWTVLRLLGPWPWYLLGAAGVAALLVTALDAPFWAARRAARANATVAGSMKSAT